MTPNSANMSASNPMLYAGLLVSIALGLFLISLSYDSAQLDGEFVPAANDSFYHAYRILDGIESDGQLKQFDNRIQVPDGSWVPWPWAYDYLMMQVGRAAVALGLTIDPMAAMVWVPPLWFVVNALLFFLISGQLGLTQVFRILSMFAYALMPLNQIGHSVGMFDHHFMEQTFVLANVFLGMRWLHNPQRKPRAMALGVALGLATAFHNGLFMLQIPLLVAVFIGWLRGAVLPRSSVWVFAGALILTTLVMLLPSAAFRQGLFEFALHSWFHAYVALGTAVAMAYMAWRAYSGKRLLGLLTIALVMSLPIAADLLRGAEFLGTDFSILGDIGEARSPLEMITRQQGWIQTMSYYSWILILTPILLFWFVIRAVRADDSRDRFFAVSAVFGLALLLTQYRLHYHGLFAMLGGTFLALQMLTLRLKLPAIGTLGLGILFLAASFKTPLDHRLFKIYPLGSDLSYAEARPLFLELSEQCKRDPGVVLASSDDGNFVLFHSDCSVVANNFIMRDSDARKIAAIERLFTSSPAAIRNDPLMIRYVLVRKLDFSVYENEEYRIVESSAIAKQLLVDEQPPAGFEHVYTMRGGKDKELLIAKLYRVNPP